MNATRYEGLKKAMVFKTGSKGLGHYPQHEAKEIRLSDELRPMSGCEPLGLRINELMGRTNGDERTAQPSTAPENERAWARRQRKKGSPVVLDDEAADLTWLCDGSLSALS